MVDALNRRDIDMIFRAETDSATRSVGELRKTVRDLRGELDRQVAAAERGEGSLDDLAKTSRELKRAQDELGTARSLLTQLNTLSTRAERSSDRVQKLSTELDELKARSEAADRPTKQLTRSIANKERALQGASERAGQDQRALAEYQSQVEAVVGPITSLEGSFREVAKTSRDVSQGLALSGQAADDYADNVRRAGEAQRELADFQQFASNAGLLQQDIDFLAQFENRIERVTAARNEQVAADLRFREGLESAQIAAERLNQANAFRNVAEQAREAARDVERFQTGAEGSDVSVRRLADAVRDLSAPARTAARDFEAIEETVADVTQRLASNDSQRVGALSVDLNNLEQALANLQRQAGQIDGLRDQQRAAAAAEAAYASAKAEVFELANALDRAGADASDDLVRSLREAETATTRAGTAWQRESQKLKQLEAAAAAAGVDITNLERAEERIIDTSRRAGDAADTLRQSLGSGSGSQGFLGLRPFELQNLSFQINDIFVGLASGQAPLTVLVQQGSQIAQLFPQIFTILRNGLPLFAALAAAATVLGAGFARASRNAQELREVRAAITELGTAGSVTEEQVIGAINQLERLGAASEEARDSITQLVKEGLDPAFFDEFSVAALNLSQITGEDLPEATGRVIEAFTQGKDAVLALDDEIRFLTDTERDQIRASDDSTDAANTRTIAFDAFLRKSQEIAEELDGPSKEAAINLRNAFNDLLDSAVLIAGYDGVQNWLADIQNGIAVTLRAISVFVRETQRRFGRLADGFNQGGVFGFFRELATLDQNAEASLGNIFETATNQLRGEQETRRAERANLNNNRTGGDPGAGTRGNRRLRESLEDEAAKKSGRSGKTEAEKLAEQLERDTERLTRALEAQTAQAIQLQNRSIEEQLTAARQSVETQYAKLFRDLDNFAEEFGGDQKIGDLTQAQFRAQVAANQELLVQQRQLQVFEKGLNDLVQERASRLAQVEERQNAGLITAQQAFQNSLEVTSELNPRIEKLADDAQRFAIGIGGANPSPQLRAFLANIEGIGITLGETRSDINTGGVNNLNQIEKDRNEILQRRQRLLQANANLVQLGLLTEADARQQAADAFNNTSAELQRLITLEREFLQTLLDNGAVSQTIFDARQAELRALESQLNFVDDRIIQVNNAAQQAFTAGFSNLFNTLAQSLANVLTQGESVGELFENLGRAALQFAADFLKAIADVIVQMLALQAFRAIFGAGTGGLGSFFFHGGSGGRSVGHGGSRMSRSGFSVSPAAVAMAPRYHNGTPGSGLRNDEMLAVLKRNEDVVTEEQQRSQSRMIAQMGRGGGGQKLRQVLAFGDDEIAGAMSGPAGEEVTVTHIRRNRSRIRQELGIDG